MSDAVFIGRNGQQLGPYSRTQLEGMAGRGEILAGDLAWHEGLAGWQPAAAVLAGMGIGVATLPPRLPAGQAPIARGGAAAASELMTQKEMYEAFIGPEKSYYYVPVFEGFDHGGSAASWNWLAGLITQWWMLYRGMLLWGFLGYPILSWVALIALIMVLTAVAGPAGGAIAMLLYLPASVVVMGLYGNKLFHNHVRGFIDRSGTLGMSEQLRREWLIRKGATGVIWIILALFFGVFLLGILSAISIPAYQDYVIRSQVSEGATLADGAKTAVSEFHTARHAMPAGNTDAGLPQPGDLHGKFVQQVQVVDGVILITYGEGANQLIKGNVLAYVPEETGAGGKLVWHCNTEQTTVKNKYRPMVCRN